jgi:hypothetical protein
VDYSISALSGLTYLEWSRFARRRYKSLDYYNIYITFGEYRIYVQGSGEDGSELWLFKCQDYATAIRNGESDRILTAQSFGMIRLTLELYLAELLRRK